MRFDDPGHLEAWRRTGRFPEIHDGIFALIDEAARGTRFLDLCCNAGLLGERIRRQVPDAFVIGVDASEAAIQAGTAAGVGFERRMMRVEAATFGELAAWVREQRVTVLVARRCLPELLSGTPLRATFAKELAAAGITEVFLQGRAANVQATNALPSVEHEVAAMAPLYKARVLRGQLAYLVQA